MVKVKHEPKYAAVPGTPCPRCGKVRIRKVRSDARCPDWLVPYCRRCKYRERKASRHRGKVGYRPCPDTAMRVANSAMKLAFGITLTQYTEMFDRQGGVCAICREPTLGKRLHIDHAHGTSPPVIRGLLCVRCNNTLGFVRDKVDVLQRMMGYLSQERT